MKNKVYFYGANPQIVADYARYIDEAVKDYTVLYRDDNCLIIEGTPRIINKLQDCHSIVIETATDYQVYHVYPNNPMIYRSV